MKRLYIHAKEFQLRADDEKTQESLRTLGGWKAYKEMLILTVWRTNQMEAKLKAWRLVEMATLVQIRIYDELAYYRGRCGEMGSGGVVGFKKAGYSWICDQLTHYCVSLI